jgi:hypothetical protein
MIWKPWAPAKCKIMVWLLLQDRLWCADRLQRRGWPNEYFCQMCLRSLQSSYHLFFDCPQTRAIWEEVRAWPGCRSLSPSEWTSEPAMAGIWSKMIHKAEARYRKGLQSLFLLTYWCIWRERNCRIFQNKSSTLHTIVPRIHDDAMEWASASAKQLRSLMFEPP